MPQPSQLPGPNADFWDWQLHGACRGEDSAVFFHPDGERGRARTQRENRAKAICRECPVLTQCRRHALEVAEPYGIWGGLSESERDLLLRPRRSNRRMVV
ncbi:WhiB family transcriptional regulator [Corynebacterium hindlerae]|uniref:Transcriptional regulator WhiB n=1 Tax=Corynebacterium hindlerae TaxID=699041 RepID=A0A7G5FHH9_9CORY|nr:WhiB family transcriptional regulator [Corynebacterium hindlerae]QMV86070.1 WhiB family transcriptional regulator [Corynebacterium hindlerae]QTH60277.1 WhiB family transcriptional regulator [Corynebacterium hindlerae]